MDTLDSLPPVDGRRFGSLTIGFDKIQAIRSEHSALAELASLVMGIPRKDLTIANVTAFRMQMEESKNT